MEGTLLQSLFVRMGLDTSQYTEGMAKVEAQSAATVGNVSTMATGMSSTVGQAMSEISATGKSGFGSFADDAGAASVRTSSSTTEASHAIRGLGEELGVQMPRFVSSWLTSLGPVAGVMSAAFVPIAVIGLIEVLDKIPGAIQTGIDWLHGWTAESKKAFEESTKEALKFDQGLLDIDEKLRQIGLIGKEGMSKYNAEVSVAAANTQAVMDKLSELMARRAKLMEVTNKPAAMSPAEIEASGMSIAEKQKKFYPTEYSNADIDKAKTELGQLNPVIDSLQDRLAELVIAEQRASAESSSQIVKDSSAVRDIQIKSDAEISISKLESSKKTNTMLESMGKISAQTNLDRELTLNQQIFDVTAERITKEMALESTQNSPQKQAELKAEWAKAEADKESQNQAARDKELQEDTKQKEQMKKVQQDFDDFAMSDMVKRRSFAQGLVQNEYMDILEADQKKQDAHIEALKIIEKADLEHQAKVVELLRQQADFDLAHNTISIAQHQALYATYNAMEEQYQTSYIQRQKDLLDATVPDYEARIAELDAQLVKMDDERRGKEQTGQQKLDDARVKSMSYFVKQGESLCKSLGSSLADLAIDGGKFGEAMMKTLKQIAKTVLEDISQYAFGSFLKVLGSALGATSQLGASLKAIGADMVKVFGGAGGTVATTAAGAAPGAAGAAIPGGAGGVAGSVGAAVGSSVMGIIGAVASVGTMVSSIYGNFQQAHANDIAGRIEGNTRGLLNVTFLNGAGTLVDCGIKTVQTLANIYNAITAGGGMSAATVVAVGGGGGPTFDLRYSTFNGISNVDDLVKQLRARVGLK